MFVAFDGDHVGESELFVGDADGLSVVIATSVSLTILDAHSSKPSYWSGVF